MLDFLSREMHRLNHKMFRYQGFWLIILDSIESGLATSSRILASLRVFRLTIYGHTTNTAPAEVVAGYNCLGLANPQANSS